MIINRGRFETELDCPRKYFHTYIQNLQPIRTAQALRQGLASHKFLEVWTKDIEAPVEERLETAVEATRQDLVESFTPMHLPGEMDEEDHFRSYVTDVMLKYIKQWGHTEPFAVLQPELDGCVDLPNGHKLRFRTDALLSYLDRLWLREFKTVSGSWGMKYSSQNYIASFYFNHQVILYVYGAMQLIGQPIAGVLLDVVKKPNEKAKPGTKWAEPEFVRETIVVTPHTLRGTVESIVYIAGEIEGKDPTNISDWPQNTTRCFDYGRCPFYDVCAMGAEARVGELYTTRKKDYVDITREEEQNAAS